ncbi:MAG: 4Fe-4S dicluster domain-containing protein [Thermoprotei archaeon]|nr:MAG: 4Fe-4S dicluster domain-containing protein [Thermoprotei archaeon]
MTERDDELVIIYDRNKCTGCMMCMIACSYKHFGVVDLNKSLRQINYSIEDGYYCAYCVHCDDPMCMASCPSNAIYIDEKNGWVLKNQYKCIGCKNCVYACPYSNPWYDEVNGVTWKCDFCDGNPECVRVCPSNATVIVTRGEARKFYFERLVKAYV